MGSSPVSDGGAESVPPRAPHCLNCGAPLAGPFCASCGQRHVEAVPSLRDLAHEIAAEHFGLDGKLARTISMLLRHPGRLTREFIAGRRVRYVAPLRLYLTLSVLFFVAAALVPAADGTGGDMVRIQFGARASPGRDTGGTGSDRMRLAPGNAAASAELHRMAADSSGNSITRLLRHRFAKRAIAVSARGSSARDELGATFREHLPDALFLLVPLAALLLSGIYRGQHRPYAEHLVFALHAQAFMFLVFLITLAPVPGRQFLALAVIAVYLFVATRTVYGGSMALTAARLTVLATGYLVALTAVVSVLALLLFLV